MMRVFLVVWVTLFALASLLLAAAHRWQEATYTILFAMLLALAGIAALLEQSLLRKSQ